MNLIEQNLDNDGIITITLNRPEKLNALSTDLLHALAEVFRSAASNPEVKALLITGNGKAFCAGADITRLAECNAQTGYEFACYGQNTFRLLAEAVSCLLRRRCEWLQPRQCLASLK